MKPSTISVHMLNDIIDCWDRTLVSGIRYPKAGGISTPEVPPLTAMITLVLLFLVMAATVGSG